MNYPKSLCVKGNYSQNFVNNPMAKILHYKDHDKQSLKLSYKFQLLHFSMYEYILKSYLSEIYD